MFSICMEVLPDNLYKAVIWPTYRDIGKKYVEKCLREIEINKFNFYDRAKKVYAVVTTSETALYANVILKKGVVCE